MDLNQIQNPNVPPMPPPAGGSMGQPMPTNAMKNKRLWFWIVVAIVVAVGAVAWWYVSRMAVIPFISEQPQIDQEAREDAMISGDIQEADLGDLDKEFMDVDQDLNSL